MACLTPSHHPPRAPALTCFRAADAATHSDSADVVINIGAYHALGDPAQALAGLHLRTRPGGRALFGLEYWRTPPTDSELANMWPDASADDCLYLPDLTALIHRSGWRILDWLAARPPEGHGIPHRGARAHRARGRGGRAP